MEFPSSVDLVFKHKYPQRLDYIFWSSPEGETALTVPKSRLDHTKVVPFVVTGMEFSHLSDHYGIETTLEYRVRQSVSQPCRIAPLIIVLSCGLWWLR